MKMIYSGRVWKLLWLLQTGIHPIFINIVIDRQIFGIFMNWVVVTYRKICSNTWMALKICIHSKKADIYTDVVENLMYLRTEPSKWLPLFGGRQLEFSRKRSKVILNMLEKCEFCFLWGLHDCMKFQSSSV